MINKICLQKKLFLVWHKYEGCLYQQASFLLILHMSQIWCTIICINGIAHVLVHFVKSIGACNVKSSSTLFSDNIQWSFEIPFPCARFKSLVGYNLITKSSNHQKWDVQAPISWNWKKHALMWEILLWKTLTRVPFEFKTYQDG